ncbi:hypothetical protein ACWDSL_37615 [Streptomyces sp. NPDC000941]
MGRAGRPQGPPKGSTEEANALAGFLRDLTAGMTVRELAERYRTSKTIWGEYRSGTKIIPLGRLNAVVKDRVRDERGRTTMLAKARRLYEAAVTAEQTVRSAEDPGAARRQAEADRAESEKLVKALLQIITALTDPDEPVGAGADAELVRQHLAEARHRLGVVREVQQAAERVLADTPERGEGEGEGEGRARAPGAEAEDENSAEDHDENRDEGRAEDRHGDRLPAISARGGLILQSAQVHDEIEEQRTEVALLWQQIRPALTGSDIVQGIVLERLDTPLTSTTPEATGVAGNADAPVTEIRPTAARPHRRRTQLILAAGVGAAVAAATAGVLLYALPGRDDAGPARTLSSPPPQPPPSSSGPAAGGPSASQSSSPTPEPSASSPRHEDARPDTESSAPAKDADDVTDPAGVYTVSEGGEVLQWSGTGKSWRSIGNDAESIVAGGAGLFRINESDKWIFQYRPASKGWERIGSPGAQFIQQGSTLYAVKPEHDAVMRWDEKGWTRVGFASSKLYAGQVGLFSTHPDSGKIFQYSGTPEKWIEVGGPGADFAVGKSVWGISPKRDAVFQWSGEPGKWFPVGDAADKIYAGGAGMFIVRESTGQILKYDGEPFSWTRIGTAGADLIVTDHKVYRVSSDHKTVSRWSGHGSTWTTIGSSATNNLAAVD